MDYDDENYDEYSDVESLNLYSEDEEELDIDEYGEEKIKEEVKEDEDEDEDIHVELNNEPEIYDKKNKKINITNISGNEMSIYEYDRCVGIIGSMISNGLKIYPEMFDLEEMINKNNEINKYVDDSNEIAKIWIKFRKQFPLPITLIRPMPDGSVENINLEDTITPLEREITKPLVL